MKTRYRQRKSCLEVVKREAGHAEALYTLGRLFFVEKDYESAISYLTRSHNIRPGFEAAKTALDEAIRESEHKTPQDQ